MGGSSLGPEVIRRSFGEIPGGLRLHVLDSTDPGAVLGARARDGPRAHALRRLLEVGRHDRDAVAHALLPRAQRGRRQPLRRRHRPGQPAGGHGAASTASGACSRTTRTSAGATRCCRTSGSCPPRWRAWTSRRCCDARAGGGAELRQQLRHERSNSGLWLGRRAGRAGAAGPRQAHVRRVDPPIESFGLWAEQLIAESTGKQGKGILPVADEPLGDAGRLRRRPRVRLPAQRRRAGRGARRAGRGAGAGRAPDGHARRARRGGPRPDLLLRRVRHRGGRLGARHQPVRPAERAGGEGQHRQGARGAASCPTVGRRATLAELLGGAAPPHYVAIMGYVRPRTSSTRRSPSCARAIRDATKATTTFGYGPRFLHSTGPVPQGRPARRAVPPARARRRARTCEIPGAGYAFGHLKNAQATATC